MAQSPYRFSVSACTEILYKCTQVFSVDSHCCLIFQRIHIIFQIQSIRRKKECARSSAHLWCCGVVRCGVLRFLGVVWFGAVVSFDAVVFCGLVWCGVVWCGVPKALLPGGKRPGCLPKGKGKGAGLCVLCARGACVAEREGFQKKSCWHSCGSCRSSRSPCCTPSLSACWCRRSSYKAQTIVLPGP